MAGNNDLEQTGRSTDPLQWVAIYADYLYKYAYARLCDEELAKDLVQETFLAALQGRAKFEGRSAEKTWLTGILKNKIADVYRKNASNFSAPASEPDFFNAIDGHWNESQRPAALASNNADPLLNKELASVLQKCMAKLPALWMSVMTMKHMDDESTETICAQLKVTTANYWVILHRAKLNLRACIQKNWL